MVSLVLVSHSKKLALATRALIRQVSGAEVRIMVASGVGDGHNELGTDAVHIAQVLKRSCRPDGAVVLMDLGSAVLSAETALELLEPEIREKVRLCPGPLIEGAMAAAVQAGAGSDLDTVCAEAQRALAAKQQQLSPGSSPAFAGTLNGEAAEIVLTLENEHGLHARPAANLVRALSKYSSEVQISDESNGRGPASARSLTSLSLLQANQGDRLRVRAVGTDRAAALAEVSALAARRFGDTPSQALPTPLEVEKPVGEQRGVPASEGIAIGPLQVLNLVAAVPKGAAPEAPAAEFEKLSAAVKAVEAALSKDAEVSKEAGEILSAQALILSDPVLLDKVRSLLEQKHLSAAEAWVEASNELSTMYQGMEDEYLRARAADVRDVTQRVLWELSGQKTAGAIDVERPSILLTRELLPSEAVLCDPAKVLGVISQRGSATAHSAILLRGRGIPMIVGVAWLDGASLAGKTVAFDGATGEVWISPDEKIVAMLTERRRQRQVKRDEAAKRRLQPSVMLDGARMEVLANVGTVTDAVAAANNGAEGIGLLRSEFLFLSSEQAPSEALQVAKLQEIFSAIPGNIIVRTLDVGADKPLPFLPRAVEQNPFLGVRGIRLSLEHPEFFLTHLRAILLAAAGREAWLMLPMISVAAEVRRTRDLLQKAHEELQSEGRPHLWPIKLGIMIEVPSAALMAEQLAEEAEFFSIGTNDLTQYVMAVERGSTALAGLQDALHPAVVRMVKAVIDGALARERHVSVCGDAASDPLAALVFAGLGIRSLSVRPKQVAEIKDLFRHVRAAELVELGRRALDCGDAEKVRSLAREATGVPEAVK
ncbi:MAG TPA: phosphoenolpyruvate--protein phosphotransferase [Terriglobales bacterium]|nr:phosphoenolpyruvate--protein phosphotransferase [Terriglobales bacterium]